MIRALKHWPSARLKQDAEEARQLKELAEQAIKDKRDAQLLSFSGGADRGANGMDPGMNPKSRATNQPGQHFMKDKFVLYKAEEEKLIEEWMERTQFGEDGANPFSVRKNKSPPLLPSDHL